MNNQSITMFGSTAHNDTTPSPWRGSLSRSEGIAFCMAFLVESLTILIMNVITVVVFTRTRALRKRKLYLMINLTVSDFLVGAVAAPIWVHYLGLDFKLWMTNHRTYHITESFGQLTTFASLINLMMVSLERMYATLWPLKHRVLGRRSYYVLIGLSWTLSIFPFLLNMADRHALIAVESFLAVWLSFTCCALLVISISYVSIWIKIKFGQHPQRHVTTAQDRKLTVSLFLVTAVSLVTWLPTKIIYIAYWFDLSSVNALSYNTYSRMHYFATLLFFANSLVNPIIYSFRMPHFRQAAVRLVCRRLAKG